MKLTHLPFPLLVVLPGVALASTPDGSTPAEEDICDDYSGAAYGLCVSYCEARDCDDPAVRASDKSCERAADKFYKKTGEELTCSTAVECTVTAADDWVDVSLNGPGTTSFNVLDNDSTDPLGESIVVDTWDTLTDLTADDPDNGDFSYDWDGNYVFEMIEYTACCGESCESATVFIVGS